MSEVVPGLAQARAMLGNIDSSKIIVGGVGVLVVLGAIYVFSADQLAGDQVQLKPKQVSANLARIGSVTLVQPPPPPVAAPAPAAEAPVDAAPVDSASSQPQTSAPVSTPAPVAKAVEPVATEAAPAVEPVATEAAPAVEPVETTSEPTVVESAPVVAEPEPAQPVEVAPAPIPAPVAAPAARPQPQWMLHMAPLRAPQR